VLTLHQLVEATTALLHDVSELVRQGAPPVRGSRCELPDVEGDLRTDGVGPGGESSGGSGRGFAGVDAHIAEVVPDRAAFGQVRLAGSDARGGLLSLALGAGGVDDRVGGVCGRK